MLLAVGGTADAVGLQVWMDPDNSRSNVASLQEATSAATASAYSIRQLLTTVWNIVLAAVLIAVAFGRSRGKQLIEESTSRAHELQAEQNT